MADLSTKALIAWVEKQKQLAHQTASGHTDNDEHEIAKAYAQHAYHFGAIIARLSADAEEIARLKQENQESRISTLSAEATIRQQAERMNIVLNAAISAFDQLPGLTPEDLPVLFQQLAVAAWRQR